MVKTVMQNADQQQLLQKNQHQSSSSSLRGLFCGEPIETLFTSSSSHRGSTDYHSLGAIPHSMSKSSTNQSSNNSSSTNNIVSSLTNNRLYSVESIVKLTSSPLISNNTSKSSSTTNLNAVSQQSALGKIPHSSTSNVTSFTQALFNSATSAAAATNGNNTNSSCLNNNNHHHHHHHHLPHQPITNSHVSIITSAEQKKHLAKMSSAASSTLCSSDSQQQHNQTTQNNGTNSVTTDDTSSNSSVVVVGASGSKTPVKPKPMVATPQQVMALYMNKLTPYEHHEIYKYSEIYFIGANAKKRPGIIGPNNSDYDNDQGSYIQIPHDHIGYRYEVLKIIGKGSFGQVVKAYDHKTHEHVALKMVRNEKRFFRQAQEEIRILLHLRKQDRDNTFNVIHIYDYFIFRNHMCITFELLYINLYELIKKNKFLGFNLQLVRKFAHSLLQCLDALYKNSIIHCDMKPENILLKQQGRSGIKVIDFGSSCYESQRVYTYIQSRFYRAPEVILGGKYSMAIDMWSLGCILAELYTGFALLPGEDEADQLACMIELLGMPPQSVLDSSKRAKNFITAKGYPRYCTVNINQDGKPEFYGGFSRRGKPRGPPGIKKMGFLLKFNVILNLPGSRDLKRALKGCDDQLFLHFLKCCLEWDQHQRITPSEALKHSWFRRRLPKPPNGSGSSSLPSTSGGSTTSSTKTVTSNDVSLNENSITTSSSNISNQTNSSNPVTNAVTAALRAEILNGASSKMATLPNKLRVQISATSNDDMIGNTNTFTSSFTRTLQSSSSLTSLPQSSATGTFRPILSSHHSTIENNSSGNSSSIVSNSASNGISSLLLQSTGTTKLPIIGGQRNTIT
uniref:dual-specificity kinase n=1 Tax=Culicoides sonorensis TaxID=179676 RepID=A0A336M288_CULSO